MYGGVGVVAFGFSFSFSATLSSASVAGSWGRGEVGERSSCVGWGSSSGEERVLVDDGSRRAVSAGGEVVDGSAGSSGGSSGPSQPSCRPRIYSFHVCLPITISPLNPS